MAITWFWDYLHCVKAYTVLRLFRVDIMRKHRMICQLEDKKPIENIQYLINLYTSMYVEKILQTNDLSKSEQIAMLNKILGIFLENGNT